MGETAEVTLVLGGARSGKSEVAERLAADLAAAGGLPVVYVATGTFAGTDAGAAGREGADPADPLEPDGPAADPADPLEPDGSWAARVAAHRARRPAGWATVEVAQADDLAGALAAAEGVALVDSLGTWAVGLPGFGAGAPAAVDALVRALGERRAAGHPTVVVSEEVGLGVHPSTPAGSQFRDALGTLNRRVADAADVVLLVVAGRVLPLGTAVPGR